MYVQPMSNRLPFGNVTDDVWAVFSKLPAGFDATNGTIKFFPYQGNLYLTCGTEMWVKKCHDKGDPAIKESSLNNWPKLYQKEWEHVGNQCLPTRNVLDIVPWATLSVDKEVMKFHLIILTSDGALQVLQGESIGAQNTFQSLTCGTTTSIQAVPVWTRIAYHNDSLIGCDKDNNLWDIKPDFANNAYKLENKYAAGQDDTFTEFTANDVGLVVAKKDGFLHKRMAATVDTSKAAQDGTATAHQGTEWIRWIPLDGVQHLGVASSVSLQVSLLQVLSSSWLAVPFS